ncbi:MAG: hypothetical protein COU35_01205 [Candidatus Magasanikbacteria bacterium CG10_big_fil_rev_8_21_14_0_10_47_10]|uniref:Uncharacterized protein n=1 Tax=Candidatus Magasanikbacteria bacterium CG10_big_fil_rev_8_21_14_0_10_47_10 TaxID=1974652 RepID=A0A2H0TR94_9BACT|nr:MAG: hypothetical protein COU35_01205 [Candidatus Magasanikbacteria bacterium CG10_big_fil_rev_8_21_14_0_10_47_10]
MPTVSTSIVTTVGLAKEVRMPDDRQCEELDSDASRRMLDEGCPHDEDASATPQRGRRESTPEKSPGDQKPLAK